MATKIRSPAFMVALVVLLSVSVLVSGMVPMDKSQLEAWFNQQVKPCTQRKDTLDHQLLMAELGKRVIKVMKDGSGDCKTITEAINKIPSGNTNRVIVHIGPGVYTEQIKIDKSKPFITFYGSPNNMPNLTYCGGATVDVESEYFMAANIIFSNSSPKQYGKSIDVKKKDHKSNGAQAETHTQTGTQTHKSNGAQAETHTQAGTQTQAQAHAQAQTHAQAQAQTHAQAQAQAQAQTHAQAQAKTQSTQALKISGDKAAFYGCKFMGLRDTLQDDKGRHFFKGCIIQGALDFIYGSAKSLYLNSKVHVLADNGLTSIVAHDRNSKSEDTGFVFVHCDVTGANSKTYLGRAWSTFPQAVYAYSNLGPINPAGWVHSLHHNHGAGNVDFFEYMNQGPGAKTNKREKFAKVLSAAQAQSFISLSYIQASTWLLPAP